MKEVRERERKRERGLAESRKTDRRYRLGKGQWRAKPIPDEEQIKGREDGRKPERNGGGRRQRVHPHLPTPPPSSVHPNLAHKAQVHTARDLASGPEHTATASHLDSFGVYGLPSMTAPRTLPPQT